MPRGGAGGAAGGCRWCGGGRRAHCAAPRAAAAGVYVCAAGRVPGPGLPGHTLGMTRKSCAVRLHWRYLKGLVKALRL